MQDKKLEVVKKVQAMKASNAILEKNLAVYASLKKIKRYM